MADRERVVTAAEMDLMTPNERAAVVDEGSTTDLDSLPPELRDQVIATAQRLSAELEARRTA